MWLWILIGLNISELKGYSDGDFAQACDSMLPVHNRPGGFFPPQTSELPYEINFQYGRRIEDPITGGQVWLDLTAHSLFSVFKLSVWWVFKQFSVILKGKDSRRFKGFMLEARDRNLGGDGPPVGKFITLDSQMTRLLRCHNLPVSYFSSKWIYIMCICCV